MLRDLWYCIACCMSESVIWAGIWPAEDNKNEERIRCNVNTVRCKKAGETHEVEGRVA